MALDAGPQVRGVLLKGAGKAFYAGIDVNELAGKTALENREWIKCMERPLEAVSRMRTPVVAQLQGLRPPTARDSSEITPERVIDFLETLPKDHRHCAELAVGALYRALADLRRKQREPWRKMYRQSG